MKEIFDNYVEHSFGALKQAPFKYSQFKYNYKKFFPKDYKISLLDIGIGRGEMLTCMKNWGYKNIFGIDISPSTIKFCRSLNLPCKLIKNTPTYLFKHKNSFDVVTLLDVLEHIPKNEMVPFLKSIRFSMRPGGLLIIQVPNLQAADAYLHRYNDITHEFGFIEHSFAQVLLAAGFKKFSFTGFELFTSGSIFDQIKKLFRSIHRAIVRFSRGINGNINPKILDPVFFARIYNE
jgi:SAM-dependent methyltransferase